MPIYAYHCDQCGVEKDVLQKVSDAPLTVCPECGGTSFRKKLSAPAFQLKGSGWYVTDFRDGAKGAAAAKSEDKPAEGKATDGKAADGKAGDGKATEGGVAASAGASSGTPAAPGAAAAQPVAPGASSPKGS